MLTIIRDSVYISPIPAQMNDADCTIIPSLAPEEAHYIRALSDNEECHWYHFARPNDYYWAQQQFGQWLKTFTGSAAPSIIDVGGGRGVFAAYMKSKFPSIDIDLLDSGEVGNSYAKLAWDPLSPPKFARHYRRVSFEGYNSIKEFAASVSGYDVVVSISALEHFSEIVRDPESLSHISEVCRPGGLILITTDVCMCDDAEGPLSNGVYFNYDKFFTSLSLSEDDEEFLRTKVRTFPPSGNAYDFLFFAMRKD